MPLPFLHCQSPPHKSQSLICLGLPPVSDEEKAGDDDVEKLKNGYKSIANENHDKNLRSDLNEAIVKEDGDHREKLSIEKKEISFPRREEKFGDGRGSSNLTRKMDSVSVHCRKESSISG